MMSFTEAEDYHSKLIREGANMLNIKNWHSHYLFGTAIFVLVALSKRGVVYNPPGH